MTRKQYIIISFAITTAILGVILVFGPKKHITFDEASPYDMTTGAHGKKKVLIFTSRGGGGHVSVSNSLYSYLKDDYVIGSVFIFTDILDQVDPLQGVFRKNFTGEDWYNYLIRKKWNRLINLTYDFGSWYYYARRKGVANLLEQYLTKHKPDLIISVVPLVNNIILSVAQKMNIPFLLIPTDLDATIAINRIHKPEYDKFHLALSYNEPEILQTIESAQIPQEQISFVGFPVRPDFFRPHNERSIKKDFDIPADKPVILLLMGAQGSQELYEFSRQLAKLTIPAHVIIAIGRSENLRKSISRIVFPKHITRTIQGFTDRMSDLMAISDVFITKSGSVSLNEAIYAQLPMLIDATSPALAWEKFNHSFVTNHGFGCLVKRYFQIPTLVTRLINDKQVRIQLKKNFETFAPKNTEQEIKKIVRDMLSE